MNTVECLDPATRRWHRVASMLHIRRYHSVVAHNRQLYAVGGYDSSAVLDSVETYDPRTNRWCEYHSSLATKEAGINKKTGNHLNKKIINP